MFKSFIRKLKSRKGNSLAEFAVTTAMMATLATTAAPKFGAVGADKDGNVLYSFQLDVEEAL